MTLDPPFRPARADDAAAIAELFAISSGGVANYVWSLMQDDYPGLSLLEIGAERYARPGQIFSYEKCVVADVDGAVGGMMHAYVMPEAEPGGLDDVPEVLRPYAELEVAGSYYISGVALLPDFRNRGLGGGFLDIARRAAKAEGCAEMSLIAFERNEGAVRLYLREGWATVDRRPVVPHPLIRYTGDALLMTKGV